MDCPSSQALLHGYIDGELELGSALELERHLASCPSCERERRVHEALRAGLRSASLAHRAPDALRLRVAGAVRSGDDPRRAWPSPLPAVWPAALALAAFLLGLQVPAWRAGLAADARLGEIVDGHVRALRSGHLLDVASSDRHTVKPWFAGKIDYAPAVADLSADGFPLAGGRLDALGGRPAAALVYKRREHVIDVYVWPAPAGTSPGRAARTIRGFHLERWTRGDLVHCAVSDLDAGELARFAALLGRE